MGEEGPQVEASCPLAGKLELSIKASDPQYSSSLSGVCRIPGGPHLIWIRLTHFVALSPCKERRDSEETGGPSGDIHLSRALSFFP